MKKITAIITGGVLLLGVSIVSFSDASRDAYHAYLTSKKFQNQGEKRFSERKIRTNSERKYTRNFQKSYQNTARISVSRKGNQSEAFYRSKAKKRISVVDQAVEKPAENVITTRFRPSTNAIPGLTHVKKTISKPRIDIPRTYSALELNTYQNDKFSLQMPKELVPVEGKEHTFTFPGTKFELSVKSIGEGNRRGHSVCGKTGFIFCASGLSNNENNKAVSGRGKLIPSTKIERLMIKTDKVLHDLTTIVPTYTETFAAVTPGQDDELIYSRYFVENTDGVVFLVEAKYPGNTAKFYVGLTKQLFESFRIYPAGYTKQ